MKKEEFTSDFLTFFLIPKDWESKIKRALRKSAKELLKTSEYYKDFKDFHEVDPEDALFFILQEYLKKK